MAGLTLLSKDSGLTFPSSKVNLCISQLLLIYQ